MKPLTVLAAAMVITCTSGCTTPTKNVARDSAATFSLDEVTDARLSDEERDRVNDEKIEKALLDALNFCQPRLSGFEAAAAKQAKRAYWLSMSGLVAGSVFAPALVAANATANATWVAGLSGWAGATNFAGQALKSSGMSGSTQAETRNRITQSVREAIEIATDGTLPFSQRRAALMRARSECVLYEIAVPSIPQP